jgi:hypothetical protein
MQRRSQSRFEVQNAESERHVIANNVKSFIFHRRSSEHTPK